jgi:arylsulfatase A-like enzyme
MKRFSRRNLLRTAATGGAALAVAATARPSDAQVRRPNIVFILADDMGYADVSCYGRRDLLTPNIDRIAAQGTRFTQAYANSPVCTASRVAIITGRYQTRLPVGLEEFSANVGMSGASAERVSLVTAYAFILPARISGS